MQPRRAAPLATARASESDDRTRATKAGRPPTTSVATLAASNARIGSPRRFRRPRRVVPRLNRSPSAGPHRVNRVDHDQQTRSARIGRRRPVNDGRAVTPRPQRSTKSADRAARQAVRGSGLAIRPDRGVLGTGTAQRADQTARNGIDVPFRAGLALGHVQPNLEQRRSENLHGVCGEGLGLGGEIQRMRPFPPRSRPYGTTSATSRGLSLHRNRGSRSGARTSSALARPWASLASKVQARRPPHSKCLKHPGVGAAVHRRGKPGRVGHHALS